MSHSFFQSGIYWVAIRRKGASDQEIFDALRKRVSKYHTGVIRHDKQYWFIGGEVPKIGIGSAWPGNEMTMFSGKVLAKMMRDLLDIPYPKTNKHRQLDLFGTDSAILTDSRKTLKLNKGRVEGPINRQTA